MFPSQKNAEKNAKLKSQWNTKQRSLSEKMTYIFKTDDEAARRCAHLLPVFFAISHPDLSRASSSLNLFPIYLPESGRLPRSRRSAAPFRDVAITRMVKNGNLFRGN